ncbi:MAG: glycosyltransferase family 2 protein [Acidobacteriota bacterium]
MSDSQEQRGEVDVSIIVALLNEEENVEPLYKELAEMMSAQELSYEVIFVDDGSQDETVARLRAAAEGDERVTILSFMKRFGQTAALAAGFDHARGQVFVPMDGDLQNDPADIPKLVAKLDEDDGYDIVSGWRKDRQDDMVTRKIPSLIANRLVRRLTWTGEVSDFGCTMKAYRRRVLADVTLYGEMHRLLPAACKWRGARITEVPVNHRARVAGETKYGLKRTFKVLLDLITMKFIGDYLTKPIYFFGKLSFVSMSIASVSLGVAILQKFGIFYGDAPGDHLNLNRNVLVMFSMMLFLTSMMLLMLGVMAELLVRVYHESQDRTPYKVRKLYRWRDGEAKVVEPDVGRKPVGAAV